MIRTFHHRDYPADRLAVEREATVSVVVPTRECAATIGPISAVLSGLREQGVVDQVLVVDADSSDGTARVAAAAGAEVVLENALLPAFGPTCGKGDAIWRALSICHGDVVCFLDGDTANFGEHFVTGTLGPLLLEDRVEFVKGFYRRPFRTADREFPDGGRPRHRAHRPSTSAPLLARARGRPPAASG